MRTVTTHMDRSTVLVRKDILEMEPHAEVGLSFVTVFIKDFTTVEKLRASFIFNRLTMTRKVYEHLHEHARLILPQLEK